MTRTVKPLELIEPKHLKFYSCGPTVYSFAHIGNFRTFITGDLIVRTAEALGWQVSYVSNITDVGHLTEDDVADASGEDKMERALKAGDGKKFANVWDLAEYYADAFKADWERLNLRKPLVWPRATQHMREQIVAIEELIDKGNAYQTESAVYFRINSFPEHGNLSGNTNKDNLQVGVRDVVQDPTKESPGDFALWKKDDKHLMQWYSPWGWGFPGWHIECSVMAMQYLGETIDLHAGGEDLIFPHHESEIAQSECLTGKTFANHWLHTRFLLVDGEKMSKSKGNYYTVRDLVEGRNVDPIALRLALMVVPYNKNLNFTLQGLDDATKNINRFRDCREYVERAQGKDDHAPTLAAELDAIFDLALGAMCDDLNTSVAIANALEGVRVINQVRESLGGESARAALAFLNRIHELLGIVPATQSEEEGDSDVVQQITQLIQQRDEAKKARDFSRADEIRAQVEALGFELRDTPEGTTYRRITT